MGVSLMNSWNQKFCYIMLCIVLILLCKAVVSIMLLSLFMCVGVLVSHTYTAFITACLWVLWSLQLMWYY